MVKTNLTLISHNNFDQITDVSALVLYLLIGSFHKLRAYEDEGQHKVKG